MPPKAPPSARKRSQRSEILSIDAATGQLFHVESGQPLRQCLQPPIEDDACYANGFDCDICHESFDPQPFWHIAGCDCCVHCAAEIRRNASRAATVTGTPGQTSSAFRGGVATVSVGATKLSARRDVKREMSKSSPRGQKKEAGVLDVKREEGQSVRRSSLAPRTFESSALRVSHVLFPAVTDIFGDTRLVCGYSVEGLSRSSLHSDPDTRLTTSYVCEEDGRKRAWLVGAESPILKKHWNLLQLKGKPKTPLSDNVSIHPIVGGTAGFKRTEPRVHSFLHDVACPAPSSSPIKVRADPDGMPKRSPSITCGTRSWLQLPAEVVSTPLSSHPTAVPTTIVGCSLQLLRTAPLLEASDGAGLPEPDILTAHPEYICFFLSNGSIQVVDLLLRTELLLVPDHAPQVIVGSVTEENLKEMEYFAKHVALRLVQR
jgi:hypothetical protein